MHNYLHYWPALFIFAGIFGASLAPYAATYLAKTYGLQYVGYYLSGAAVLSLMVARAA